MIQSKIHNESNDLECVMHECYQKNQIRENLTISNHRFSFGRNVCTNGEWYSYQNEREQKASNSIYSIYRVDYHV